MSLIAHLALGIGVALLAGAFTGRAAGRTDLAAGSIAAMIGWAAATLDAVVQFGAALPILLTIVLACSMGTPRATMERTDRWFVEDGR